MIVASSLQHKPKHTQNITEKCTQNRRFFSKNMYEKITCDLSDERLYNVSYVCDQENNAF